MYCLTSTKHFSLKNPNHYSVFLLPAFVALVGASSCLDDIKAAGLDVAAAAGDIGKAILDCRTSPTKCAADISAAVTSLGQASEVITLAVTDCGGTNNTACAKDITAIATALGETSTVIEHAVTDCHTLGAACVADVKEVLMDVVGIVEDIDHAVSDCKSSSPVQSVLTVMDPEFLEYLRNPEAGTHYGDPSSGCLPDESAVQIQSIQGDFCTSKCSLTKACPTDVPAGVKAKPTCALEDSSTKQKFCALICDPKGTSSCGSEATCKAIGGVGICTYND